MLGASATRELVSALFDRATVPAWVFDRETLRFLEVNEEAERRYGYSRDEFLGMTILDIRPPEDVQAAWAEVGRPASSRPGACWRHRLASGQLIDVEIRRTADFVLDGRPVRLVFVREVTEERRALAALQANERRFRAVLENSTDALLFQSAEGRPIWASASAEHVFGCPREQIIGRQGLDLVHPDDKDAIRAARAEALARPFERIRCLARYRAVDGAPWRWLETVRENRLDDPAVSAIVVHMRDVTDQKLAEERLRRSEESFRTAIESSPDLVVVVRDGIVIYANAAILAAVGRGHDEVMGHPVLGFVHGEDHAAVSARLSRASLAHTEVEEIRLLTAGGSPRSVEFRAVSVQFAGAPAVLAFGRDVTDRRELQARLAVAARMSSLGTLAAGIAHEINNPVAYALGNVSFLAEALGPHLATSPAGERSELEEALRDTREGLERVRDIVRGLKSFSRGDDETLGAVELGTALDAACALTSNELKHRARLVVSGIEGPVWVRANEGQLAQVFVNLLVNAAHAIPEGAAATNEVRVSVSRRDGGEVVVEVRDTGAGISPEHLPRLFEPFFTTKPKGVGTGLGLSICESIVRAHGGSIEVESTVGQGACFRVSLRSASPGVPDVDPARGAERAPEPPSVRPASVLVVDDEPAVGQAIVRLLGDHPARAVTLGKEALELLRAGARFDAVLCDVMMPDLSGVQLHSEVSALAPEQAGRFVFMTGGVFSAETRRLLAAAGRPVLHKPFDKGQLLACLAALQTARARP